MLPSVRTIEAKIDWELHWREQKQQWCAMQVVELSTPSDHWLFSKLSGNLEQLLSCTIQVECSQLIAQRINWLGSDCGMTHFHDDEIKKALSEIAPEEKSAIDEMKFGEILEYVASSYSCLRSVSTLYWHKTVLKKVSERIWLFWELPHWSKRRLRLWACIWTSWPEFSLRWSESVDVCCKVDRVGVLVSLLVFK